MSTVEDVLLVATDPVKGTSRLSSTVRDVVLGGAILFDLVREGRLAVEGRKKSRLKVVVADPSPLGDSVLDAALERVRERGRQSPRATVGRLGKHAQKSTYAQLASRGVVRPREQKVLGLFPVTRHEVADPVRRDALAQSTRAVLLHGQPADDTTGPVIGLLAAADLLKLVVERPDLKAAKARAKVITEGDWASEAVRDAVRAAQAAVTAGVMAAVTVTSAGG